jgi:hypothetical protein
LPNLEKIWRSVYLDDEDIMSDPVDRKAQETGDEGQDVLVNCKVEVPEAVGGGVEGRAEGLGMRGVDWTIFDSDGPVLAVVLLSMKLGK